MHEREILNSPGSYEKRQNTTRGSLIIIIPRQKRPYRRMGGRRSSNPSPTKNLHPPSEDIRNRNTPFPPHRLRSRPGSPASGPRKKPPNNGNNRGPVSDNHVAVA